MEALPIPTVDIPVTYDFTPLDQAIYITQDAALDGTFTTAAGFVADGVNNAYVDIVYTIASGGTTLGTYTIPAGTASGSWDTADLTLSGLTDNTAYTISCTVSPVDGPVTPLTVNRTATVYVWKPEVTFRDTVIYLGETADYSDNYVLTAWKKQRCGGADFHPALLPTLSYQFTPDADTFTADTYVTVTARIDGVNITGHTSFTHEACS